MPGYHITCTVLDITALDITDTLTLVYYGLMQSSALLYLSLYLPAYWHNNFLKNGFQFLSASLYFSKRGAY